MVSRSIQSEIIRSMREGAYAGVWNTTELIINRYHIKELENKVKN